MTTLTVTDQIGRLVRLPASPRRIVSLVPSQTELLYDLGLREEVVGITKFCVHPENWFRQKPRVGGTKKVKIDIVRQLEPDLIIGNKEENTKADIETLAADFPVWISDVGQLDEALAMIREVGALVGRPEPAARLAAELQIRFDALAESGPAAPKQRAAYFIWRQPFMVAGGGTFINDMLERAGFANVFSHRPRYPEVSLEELHRAAPEVVLLSSEPYPFKDKHLDEFREACPPATVTTVDGELFSWYGSRLLQSAAYFRKLRVSLRSGAAEE